MQRVILYCATLGGGGAVLLAFCGLSDGRMIKGDQTDEDD